MEITPASTGWCGVTTWMLTKSIRHRYTAAGQVDAIASTLGEDVSCRA